MFFKTNPEEAAATQHVWDLGKNSMKWLSELIKISKIIFDLIVFTYNSSGVSCSLFFLQEDDIDDEHIIAFAEESDPGKEKPVWGILVDADFCQIFMDYLYILYIWYLFWLMKLIPSFNSGRPSVHSYTVVFFSTPQMVLSSWRSWSKLPRITQKTPTSALSGLTLTTSPW